jgi:hypothetical protein
MAKKEKELPVAELLNPVDEEETNPTPVKLPGTLLRHIGPNNPKSVTLRIQHQNLCFCFDRPGYTCVVLEPEAVKVLLGMTYKIDNTEYPMFEKMD